MENFECKSCSAEPTGRINLARFLDRLDACFARGDLAAAGECLAFWENEARGYNDSCGLLSVLNEEIGYYRRTGEREKGLGAVSEALQLLQFKGLTDHISGATIFINAATTLKAFGKAEEGLPLYDTAAEIYKECGKTDSYEYAALLNNKAAALCELRRFDEGQATYEQAIAILEKEGKHDGEIAVSLVNLAHLYYDRDDTAFADVEALLDRAWEMINSPRQPHDANYAFILEKCAPSFRYFKREIEAEALEEVSKEIYGK
ncbi:MAG: tetratricopeptide repeat protein [Clostridia bacterium]|nr:tetratricopeptide repeat protein [Clostridia bacterium]